MKITYGKTDLRIKNIYLYATLIIFLTESLFYTFLFGKIDPQQPPPLELEKYIIPFYFVIGFISFFYLNNYLRGWMLAVNFYLLVLMLESYLEYNSFFRYPHVFAKIMVLYLVPVAYLAYKNAPGKALDVINFIIVIGFIVHLVLFQLDTVSVAAFTSTERSFPAQSAYFMVLPLVYFFNKYLSTSRIFFLLVFFMVAAFIVFMNHRSIWLASMVAIFINLLLVKKSSYNLGFNTIMPIIVIPLVALFLVSSFVLSTYPEIVTTLVERFSDIENVEETGTGKWRLMQFEAYLPFIFDHPIFGMRLEGFELPIQFFEHTGLQPWPDGTGHHFHSFYIDRLFYFGLVGLAFLIHIMYYVIKSIFNRKTLTLAQIVFISYTLSGIIFGLSYNWPSFFYFFIGITISYINKNNTDNNFLPSSDQLGGVRKSKIAEPKSAKLTLR